MRTRTPLWEVQTEAEPVCLDRVLDVALGPPRLPRETHADLRPVLVLGAINLGIFALAVYGAGHLIGLWA